MDCLHRGGDRFSPYERFHIMASYIGTHTCVHGCHCQARRPCGSSTDCLSLLVAVTLGRQYPGPLLSLQGDLFVSGCGSRDIMTTQIHGNDGADGETESRAVCGHRVPHTTSAGAPWPLYLEVRLRRPHDRQGTCAEDSRGLSEQIPFGAFSQPPRQSLSHAQTSFFLPL